MPRNFVTLDKEVAKNFFLSPTANEAEQKVHKK